MHWIISLNDSLEFKNRIAVCVRNDIYAIGGFRDLIDVHKLDTRTMKWKLLSPGINENGTPLTYPEVPNRRFCHTAVAYNDKIYMWGGYNSEFSYNQLYCFDPIAKYNNWTRPTVSGCIPTGRHGHSACIADNCMYIFGGWDGELRNDIHRLKLETMEWTYVQTCGEIPSGRERHLAIVVQNRMYIFGDQYYDEYLSEIFYLDLKTNRWHCPLIIGEMPDECRAMFTYNDFIYVVGGIKECKPQYLYNLFAFGPMSNCWQLVKAHGNPPNSRGRQMCVVIGSKVFFFADTSIFYQGSSIPIFYNAVHVLDFEPSLKTLSILAIIKNRLDISRLPNKLKNEIRAMMDDPLPYQTLRTFINYY